MPAKLARLWRWREAPREAQREAQREALPAERRAKLAFSLFS